MRARQKPPRRRARPLPLIWLLTDERADAALEAALARAPRGTGVIFRHHATAPAERRRRYRAVRRICRARGLPLLLAGSPREAIGWRADGAHGRSPHRTAARPLIRTAPAHDARELAAAARGACDLALLSPVFATRSHPRGQTMGVVRFGLLARAARLPVAALGGMDAARFRRLAAAGAAGWGAIDAWAEAGAYRGQRRPDQKRKVVPR